jgi:hypothetical protein
VVSFTPRPLYPGERAPGTVEDYIKTYPKEVGGEVVDWIQLAQNEAQLWVYVDGVTKLRFPQKVRNFLIG